MTHQYMEIKIEELERRIKALEKEPKSPCDLCRYNPPSSSDGKPCTMCQAESGDKEMTNGEIIEQLENAIGLIKQDGKDWLDDRDIPILEACIKSLKSLTSLDKIRAEIEKVFCISVITDELRTPMEVKTEILQIIDKHIRGDVDE